MDAPTLAARGAPHAPAAPRGEGLARALLIRLLSPVVVIGAWEYAGRAGLSPAFPGFGETFAALLAMIADGSLPAAFLVTLKPLALGLAISVAFGVGLGVAMGLSERTEWLIAPLFIVAQAAPLAALIPVLTFAYGIGLTSKILTVCVMAMPVIVLNSLGAVRNTPTPLLEMARAFLGSRRQVILKVILPSASPMIFAGLRLGCAAAFIGVILAELLITPTGIGDLITYNQSIADYPPMYAAILSVVVFSVAFIGLLERIETRLFRPERRAA